MPYRLRMSALNSSEGRQSQLRRVCANVGSSRSTLTEPTSPQAPTHTLPHLTSFTQLNLLTTKSPLDLHITKNSPLCTLEASLSH